MLNNFLSLVSNSTRSVIKTPTDSTKSKNIFATSSTSGQMNG